MQDVQVIEDPAAAAVALDPVRARLLAELAEPGSAAALAALTALDQLEVRRVGRRKAQPHLRGFVAAAKRVERLGRGLQRVIRPAVDREQCVNERLGGLSVLVNNVGNYLYKPLADVSLEEWDDVLASNLDATFMTCRAAVPLMRAAGGGRIVNLGYAGAQHLVGRPNQTAYTIAKTGVVQGRSTTGACLASGPA